jgi:hypothetical protein
MSICLPRASGRELDAVVVGIPEIEAAAAMRPADLALYGNVRIMQSRFPGVVLDCLYPERNMRLSIAIVRRDDASVSDYRVSGFSFSEEKEYLFSQYIKGTNTFVVSHKDRESEEIDIEIRGTFDVIDINC